MDTTTDEQRFTELYRQHYAAVSAYVRRRIDADQVTDVVAEVFAIAWRRLDEIPRRAVLPWLYGVARRTLANAHRSNRRRLDLLEVLGGEPAHEVGDHAEAVIQRHGIACAFEALSDRDQETLRLSFWEGLSASNAARALGCSTATYQVRLHRARKRLRTHLAAGVSGRAMRAGVPAGQTHKRGWGGADA
ncbi:sigma-70 family RNA polymerase sigma factor [Streptomyces sp. NPDC097610]|uniref:RNA polymerase sigma factor n=1 Tax=Streptomyces sp. NPDC097610 TaxID=3157227 RepID=UPI00331E21CC